MTVTLREQISLFAFCILCGAAVAVVFDLFRISRRLVRTSVWLTALEDVFFCILMAAMVFFVGLMCNDGEFRWYMLAGTLLGALMYFKTLSRAVRAFWYGCWNGSTKSRCCCSGSRFIRSACWCGW